MTSSALAGLSDADRYVVGRLAAREHVPVEKLAELPQAEIDQHIPGARVAYEHRAQIAAELLRRRLSTHLSGVSGRSRRSPKRP